MRMAFCLDGDYERRLGSRRSSSAIGSSCGCRSEADPLSGAELEAVREQVARVISLDHDGEAFHQCVSQTPCSRRCHSRAPGFRPALFYSPYEAALWSILSARRARSQGITLRARMSEMYGAGFELSGIRTLVWPTPTALLDMSRCAGLPADRIPRIRAVAEAARRG
jgi:DNA-3-methyladenine glycosylase II